MAQIKILALDVGGTKTSLGLFEASSRGSWELERLGYLKIPTNRDAGYDSILKNTTQAAQDLLAKSGLTGADLSVCAAGMPGTIDPPTQIFVEGNSPMFKGHHFVQDLARALGSSASIYTENDANCFALAEVFSGAGLLYEKETSLPRDKQIGVGIIIGTGTGSGVVVEGRILRGARGAAGEVGHLTLHEGGHDCYCGRKGCAEQYLSGPALKAQGGDLKRYAKDLGLFLAQLTNAFDPHWFVLGGGVSKESKIYSDLARLIEPHLFIKQKAPRVYRHQISDDAGLLGAALLGVG